MLNFGISPCPNDIYIFYAILKGKIDLKGLRFKFIIEDVEKLNEFCLNDSLEISKISAHAFYYLRDRYDLLNRGAAISESGPVLVTKDLERISKLKQIKIALPGKLTTASALMWFYWKKHFAERDFSLSFTPFNQIVREVQEERADMGVLIHEGRFIYESYGLRLIADLGDFWKKETGSPIPLGCIVMRKDTKLDKQILENMIQQSIDYSKENFNEVLPFIKIYAQELNEEVIISHIQTYVNEYSYDLGDSGKKAIDILIEKLDREGIWS